MQIPIYFKKIFTEEIKYYYVDSSWTCIELYEKLKHLIYYDFNILKFELVEISKRIIDINNIKSELRPKFELSNEKLINLFGHNLEVAFYIRPLY